MLGFPPPTRQKGGVTVLARFRLLPPVPAGAVPVLGAAACALAALGWTLGGAGLRAQIEGERGVPPIDSSSSFEVGGIEVDVAGPNADAARLGGWREAQRRGWKALWARTHGGTPGPSLSDSALDQMVAGIVVEDEQIGPRRYVARLGVLFDRARTGQILGASGGLRRSAPMLVLPIEWSGGTAQALEARSLWQQAWARFRTGSSPVDYVRPTGTGVDPLVLNAGQSLRPGRNWWRLLLDSYGAADVLIPEVRLLREWPGGPVIGRFSAYHGPDRQYLGGFVLRVGSSEALPRLMDEGVKRMDALYAAALQAGRLSPDPGLAIDMAALLPETVDDPVDMAGDDGQLTDAPPPAATAVTIQFDTPDAAAVSAAEAAVRAVPGVRGAATSSLALGGVSVMRVTFEGDQAALRAALVARGWQVQEGAGALRIRRGGAQPPR
ncbi:heavy-metal-associated domain-containing protein [Sphingomonas changnyeongensis]|uniref:heavy-metal-associated domain-containing protein n=1 Tax=Sphingomonas changnyeongensis TaxID=2698679 RepID=UPI001E2E7BD3|nr:heavy-metal-associated domain-containing protein [Sphingomonas changnyeongensis]